MSFNRCASASRREVRRSAAVASAMPCAAARSCSPRIAASSRLRLCAAGGDLGQPRRRGVALLACRDQLVLALAARAPCLGQRGGEQAQARLGDLPAQRLGPLGGGRLELQRAQAGAQFALDIARALEIGGDAGELGLGALSPPLELAQPGGLLDEAAALVRPRQQHLVDGALGDDAVQVAAEAGLGQQVAHVEAPHGLAVEQVVAVARAIEAAHHRQLVARDADAAVAVVDHELDLAHAARGVLLGAGEEHVLPGLGAQLAGRLRGHGPLQRVGDVGLAGAVRADHDRDAGLEAQLQRIAERLEAAHADCAQMHSRPSRVHAQQRLLGGSLLGGLLRGALAGAEDLVTEHGGSGEAAAVRWSRGLHQPVAYGRPLTCQSFLQFRLVIDEALLAEIDAFLEGLDDRIGGLPVAELLEGRADHGLAERRQHVAARLDARLAAAPLALPLELRGEVERARHQRARAARDDVGALLREPALVGSGRAAVELLGDREPEHAVAEELQPLVRLNALVDPGRVSERASPQLLGKPLDERCERGHARR